jgi:arylsulfatase A-like enzyme
MARRRPNLLFIYTDEQAVNTLAAYGNRRIQMPNLNRFAEESVLFERAYVTQPVCTPSRSTLLTGLYPHANGCVENNVPLRPETACLPEMTPPGAYVAAHHGKWHLGDEIFAQHGFAEWVSIDDGYRRYYSAVRDKSLRSTYYRFLVENGFEPEGEIFPRGQCARLPEAFGKPAYLAREASRLIRENRDRPFILFVNFFEPHMPYYGPRDMQHDTAEVLLPPNFDAVPDETQPVKTRLMQRGYFERGHSGLPLKTEADWRRLIANYWGLCSLVDACAGEVLQTLDACGLRDDTIVIYTSDHGDMMGSHRLIAKCVMFEEAARVPMLIRLPGQRRGKRVRGPFSHIDLAPTLLDLMGVETPPGLPGVSRRAAVEGSADGVLSDDVVIEWNGTNSGVLADKVRDANLPQDLPDWMRDLGTPAALAEAIADPVRSILTADGWKLNCSPLGEHELYDLNRDPGETRNLARRPESLGRMRDLRRRLGAWQSRVGDTVRLPDI